MKNYIKIQSIICSLFFICDIAVAQVRVDSLNKISNPENAYSNWSSDGSKIVFNREIDGSIGVVTLNLSKPDVAMIEGRLFFLVYEPD